MFTQQFGKFVCEGDTITCVVETLNGIFDVTATVYRDDCADPPYERQDGFWPSRDPKNAGYVKGEKAYCEAQALAERVLDAWNNDEWFYCGIAVTVSKNGIELTGRYNNALWGIEANYPDSDNSYLTEVANELISEAVSASVHAIEKLCAK
jgi:hypothetical protein